MSHRLAPIFLAEIELGDENSLPPHVLVTNILDNWISNELSKDFKEYNMTFIEENSPLITKKRYFEEYLENKIQTPIADKDVENMKNLVKFLKSYIASERKVRARLKLKYIIVGTIEEKLDYCFDMLRDSEEIDEHLLDFVDFTISLAEKKYRDPLRNPDIAERPSIDDDSTTYIEEKEDTNLVESAGRNILTILSLIRKRIVIELKLDSEEDKKSTRFLHLLGSLLNEKDLKTRDEKMFSSLTLLEDLIDFRSYLKSAISYFYKNMSNGEESGSMEKKKRNLPDNVIEYIKDLLTTINERIETLKSSTDVMDTTQSF